jgi:hypothetical protein
MRSNSKNKKSESKVISGSSATNNDNIQFANRNILSNGNGDGNSNSKAN